MHIVYLFVGDSQDPILTPTVFVDFLQFVTKQKFFYRGNVLALKISKISYLRLIEQLVLVVERYLRDLFRLPLYFMGQKVLIKRY